MYTPNEWSIFVLFTLTVIDCAATDWTYLYLRATNLVSNASVEVCANYQPGSVYANSVEEASSVRLAFWPDGDDYWCRMLYNRTSMVGSAAYGIFDYRGLHCNVTDFDFLNHRLAYLKAAGGSVALLQHDYLPWWFWSTHVNMSLFNGSVFYLTPDSFSNIQTLYGGNRSRSNEVQLQFYKPLESKMPLSIILFLMVAPLCVTLGGWLSGLSHNAIFSKQKECADQEAGDEGRRALTKARTSQTNEPASLPFSCAAVVVFLLFSATILVLLFFFYTYVVYVMIFLYILGASFAIYHFLGFAVFKYECYDLKWSPPVFVNRLICCCCKNSWYKTRYVRPLRLMLFLVSLVLPLVWFVCRKQWYAFILQDVLGIILSIRVISALRMPSLKWLTILLVSFLLYDVFMVFISPLLTNGCSIMLYVASGGGCNESTISYSAEETRERLPLSLLIPHLNDILIRCVKPTAEDSYPSMLLGLGDIILPGTVVGFNFAVDLNWKTPCMLYSLISIIAYTLGLYIGLIVVIFFGKAQPALIYLVPAVLIPTHLVGLFRGEWSKLWNGVFYQPESSDTDGSQLPVSPAAGNDE